MTEEFITIPGLDDLLKEFKDLSKLPGIQAAFKAGAMHFQGHLNRFPRSSIANSPDNPTGRWYERNYGPRWKRRDGSTGGRKTSQMLSKSWIIDERSPLDMRIGTNVTYAPYVQSAELQAKIHGQRGWQTDQQVLDRETDTVIQFLLDYFDRLTR